MSSMVESFEIGSRKSISLFDFDHTIYDGDASLDFFLYVMKKNPLLLRYVPIVLWSAFLYLASIFSRKRFKEGFFSFLKEVQGIDELVEGFWSENESKLKDWYINRAHDTDIIVSASPDFLLSPLVNRIGVYKLIATRMDKRSGKIEGKNCRGSEKISRLQSELPDVRVGESYSDNLSDRPMLEIAENAYIVRKEIIIPYRDYKPSGLKSRFFKKSFLSFVFVGGLNAFIGLSFAFMESMFLENKTFAFMIGYCMGLVPSYFLNSTITFHNTDYNFKAFIKYCISYIPNFMIQTFCVGLLIEVLQVNKNIAYVVAVAVGVPITFLIVSTLAIKERETE